MAATIKIKNSSTASAVPTSSDLVQGELAVNVTDKRVFTENASGTVVELGTNPSILTLPDGSASAPTLTNDGDTNTGIFFPAADTVGITTGGTERARVDSSGNLGLGTTSPSERLHVVGKIAVSGTNPSIRQTVQNAYLDLCGGTTVGTDPSIQIAGSTTTSDANIVFYNSNTHIFRNSAGSSERMRLDASGRLGIARTSPGAQLDVLGAASTSAMRIVGNSGASIYVDLSGGGDNYYDATNNIFRNASGTERARIDSSGNLLVGTTSVLGGAAGKLALYSSDLANTANTCTMKNGTNNTGGTYARFINYLDATIGSITQSTSTAVLYNVTSDQRLKENIADADDSSALIDALQVRKFDWKADGNHQRYGFVAQELVTVAPEAVHQPANEEEMMAVDYSKLVPMLVKEIQSLRQRIATLEAA